MRSCFSRAEAPHDEPAHHVAGKGGVKPYRVRIRVPSLPNMLNSTPICYGLKSTHMPVVLVNLEPCVSHVDRVVVVNEKTRKQKLSTLKKLVVKKR